MNRKNICILISIVLILTSTFAVITATAVQAGEETVERKETTTISEAYIPSETTTLKEESTTAMETTTEEVITVKTTKKREESSKQSNKTSTSVASTKPTTENHPDTTKPKLTTTKPIVNNGKYPVATEIWNYMKALGWSDAVCAGIMGNLMAEVGGQTLNINPYLGSSSYYGMCQWSTYYYPSVNGADLETQCDFLRDTIKKEIDTYGYKYASGMNFEKFLKLEDPRAVALCFAKAYERCASGSYTLRQNHADTAYAYFVG